MAHLKTIIKNIDDSLRASTLKGAVFQAGKFWGLAKREQIKDATTSYVPAVVSAEGHGIESTPDETYPMSIYHRCLNGGFAKPQHGSGWGDSNPIAQVYNMKAVVYADPEKCRVTQEDLCFLIAAGMPEQSINITTTDSRELTAKVVPVSFNNDSIQVFTGEYQLSEYRLKPQSIYFSLDYQIEINADRACVTCP